MPICLERQEKLLSPLLIRHPRDKLKEVRRVLVPSLIGVSVLILVIGWCLVRFLYPIPHPRPPFLRPSGMAPVAFTAFLQACHAAKVHPFRIFQTLGDAPRSKGYHLRDGTLNGEDYSAAVDLGVEDLSPHKRAELLEALGRVGFAAWYRSGPKWQNGEHVHAVYAGLPMKPQLQEQVRLWNRERGKSGRKALRWQKSWRRFWR
ncbi:hypothetical protein IAD21_06250 [Abditibacteriota bacterium]|nr:hypothetical protein IAD21_06250 [Abditibacteriota bacterium]